ncbi:MAG: hypothetical protein L3J83_12655, partial [Proteobacteria bacterium]|nr:hypothetical protein [Pseudomonadota bacterium]
KSLQAQVIIPMAISLAFGILFATVITLVLIPVWYVILDKFKKSDEIYIPEASKLPNESTEIEAGSKDII